MELLTFIENLADQTPENIRSRIYDLGILSSYEKSEDTNAPHRMIFYVSKTQKSINNTQVSRLWAECNGLIINTKTLKPLVIPQYTLRHDTDSNIVNKYLSKGLYDVYYANEGTSINLYYWETLGWRISTSRGLDVTDTSWGTTTYKDILDELLNHVQLEPDEFYKSLDKSQCYTFGFKHPSMHVFYEGTEKPVRGLWFIQSVNCDSYEVCYASVWDNIPEQRKFDEVSDNDSINLSTLVPFLSQALTRFINDNEVHYGFILRSKDPVKTNTYSNILLESSLLQKIRQLYYHSNYNNVAKQMDYDREKFTIVYAYLNLNTHNLFIQLFPQYTGRYTELDNITTTLVKKVITYVQTQSHDSDSNSQQFDAYVKYIYDSLNAVYKLNANDTNIVKIISSYILTTNFVDMYYKLFMWSNNDTHKLQ